MTMMTSTADTGQLLHDLREDIQPEAALADADRLIRELQLSLRNVRIMQAKGATYDVEDGTTRIKVEVGGLVYLFIQNEYTGWTTVKSSSIEYLGHLKNRKPGYEWGDTPKPDEHWFRFTFVGIFRVIDTYYEGRTRRLIVTEAVA